jgi:CBS domain-containing protein
MIRAKTIMTENVITINENATVAEAAKLILNKHVNGLLVVKNNKPIAVVDHKNLIKGSSNKSPSKVKIKNIMSKDFLVVNPETNYSFISKKLNSEKIRKFPVVENDKLVGIITDTDVIDATRNFTKFHQAMQEVILIVFGLVTAFFLFFFSPLGQSIFQG